MPRKKGISPVGQIHPDAETFQVITASLHGTVDGLAASLASLETALEAIGAHLDANPELGDTPLS